MLKPLVASVLSFALLSQGIVHAEEAPADAANEVPIERVSRGGLDAHIDAMDVGDRVIVATDEGVVAGELVDKDADDVIVSRSLVEGGTERIAIRRREIQGVRYASNSQNPPQTHLNMTTKGLVITAVVVGALFIVGRLLFPPGP